MPPPKRKSGAETGGNPWLKYAGMAGQLGAAILFGVGLGIFADGRFGTEPILTVIGALFGVFAGLWLSIRDFL